MSEVHALVMAGGVGSRFWPLSRRRRPKQLLPLASSGRSLLAATIDRIAPLCPPERVVVVTNAALVDAVRADVPALPAAQVLGEPIGRNTAACIAWGASRIARVDPDAVCVVLPADHHVEDEAAFLAALRTAVRAAEDDAVVTIGIQPTRPETGYGYLEVAEVVGPGVHRAARFVEKPDRQRAEAFLAAGRYLWNSGMFVFRARVILAAIARHLPALGEAARAWAELDLDAELERVTADYPGLVAVSIDHGVMEKLPEVRVVPGAFGWTDLGSFESVWALGDRDEDGNRLPPRAVVVDSAGCFVEAPPTKTVALLGVRDLVVVDTADALLVMPRERAQEVKAVVRRLEDGGEDDLL